MHTFIKSISLPGSVIASFNQFDAFSRTKGKAGVFNLLKHTKVDGSLVLAIKALAVFFFVGMPQEYLQSQVQSHLVICGFCRRYHCNSLYLPRTRERNILVLHYLVQMRCKMDHNMQLLCWSRPWFLLMSVLKDTHTHTSVQTNSAAHKKLGYILTALIHQQTVMQGELKCVLVFVALTRRETVSGFSTYCILGLCSHSTLLRWNNFESEIGYGVSFLFKCSSFFSLTHKRQR